LATEYCSDIDFKAFTEMGWYVSDKILPEKLINNAKNSINEFYQGKVDFKLNTTAPIANDPEDNNSALRNNELVTLQKKAFADLAFHPSVLSRVAKLLDTKEVRLFADSLINKKPQLKNSKGIVGWHTDKAYWPTCSSNQLLTAWIPLQDVTVEMGPLELISKSNHWQHSQELKSLFGFNKTDLKELHAKASELGYPVEKKLMTIKAGQVSFHHCDTIHCSTPNVSNKNRLALAVHFQGKANHYQPAFKQNGEKIKISYDELCKKDSHGNPDYHDPDIFPLLWKDGKKVI